MSRCLSIGKTVFKLLQTNNAPFGALLLSFIIRNEERVISNDFINVYILDYKYITNC